MTPTGRYMLEGVIGGFALVAVANGYVIFVEWGAFAQYMANFLTIGMAGISGAFSLTQKYADRLHWDTETKWRLQGFSAITGVLSFVALMYLMATQPPRA